jgi:hypothetical protein
VSSTLVVLSWLVAPVATSSITAPDVEAAAVARASWFTDIELVARSSIPPLDQDLRTCGADTRCAAARAEQHGIDRLLYVIANISDRPGLLTVELVDAETKRTIANEVAALSGLDTAKLIGSSVEKALASAGHQLGARLTVNAHPADTVIVTDPSGRTPFAGSAVLAPGDYEVIATREGYETERRTVALERGADVVLDLPLEEEGSVLTSWWLWTTIGVAVAAAVVIPVVVLREGELDPFIACTSPDPERCRE